MYYLGIKCNEDPYDLDYLNFYFDDLKEMFNFATNILKLSNYEIILKKIGEDDE